MRITKSQYRTIAAKYISSVCQDIKPEILDDTELTEDEKQILTEEIQSRCAAISPDGKTYGSINEIINSVLNN